MAEALSIAIFVNGKYRTNSNDIWKVSTSWLTRDVIKI
jgi:hypothetical protein